MSHSAELKWRDVEQKELEQDVNPPLASTIFQQTCVMIPDEKPTVMALHSHCVQQLVQIVCSEIWKNE